MIVNYFDGRPHDQPKQTCGLVPDLTYCNYMIEGTSWDAIASDGSVAGTHDLKGQPHPCAPKTMGGCVQSSCIQGTEAKCHDACDALNMISPYDAQCHDHCSYGEVCLRSRSCEHHLLVLMLTAGTTHSRCSARGSSSGHPLVFGVAANSVDVRRH